MPQAIQTIQNKWTRNPYILPVILGVLSMAVAGRAAAADRSFTANIYDVDSNKQKLLFSYKDTFEDKGETRIDKHSYTTPEGEVAETEVTTWSRPSGADANAIKFISYQVSQKQIGAEGRIDAKDGQLTFTYTKDGKTKTSTEKLTDNFVVGPTVMSYLRSHWDKIKNGDKVATRFGVADRRETVGFDYFKDHEETVDGKKLWAVKMKPSSFLIAALVKPLYFMVTPDGETLVEVRGRVQPKQKVSGSYKDLDAVTTFVYDETPAAAPASGESSAGKAK